MVDGKLFSFENRPWPWFIGNPPNFYWKSTQLHVHLFSAAQALLLLNDLAAQAASCGHTLEEGGLRERRMFVVGVVLGSKHGVPAFQKATFSPVLLKNDKND